MSTVGSRTYDYPVAVTKGTTVDPAGPFAGAVCSVAGVAVFYPLTGPNTIGSGQAPISLNVIAGQELHFAIAAFHPNTTATMLGLVSAIIAIPNGTRTST
jgi:hypothetical protein